MVVLTLVTMKVLFVSLSLSNAPYFHLLGHILQMVLVCLLFKTLKPSSKMETFNFAIATSNCSAFFGLPSDPKSRKKTLGKYGGMIITLILEVLSYMIYGMIGVLIRFLQRQKLINPMNLPPKNFDRDPAHYLIKSILNDYSFIHVLAFLCSSLLIYGLVNYLYYQFGHPKKYIINQKKEKTRRRL